MKTLKQFVVTDKENNKEYNFAIKKPSRRDLENGDMFYAVELSKLIKKGVLTKAQIAKNYSETGGIWTEEEQKLYAETYKAWLEAQSELTKLQSDLVLNQDDPNAEVPDKLAEVQQKVWSLYFALQEFESKQSSIFDQTADVIARNRTVLYYIVNLLHTVDIAEDKEPKYTKFFNEASLDESLDRYDEILESDDKHFIMALNKAALFVSFWHSGKAVTEEDFSILEGILTPEEDDAAKEEVTASAE